MPFVDGQISNPKRRAVCALHIRILQDQLPLGLYLGAALEVESPIAEQALL